YNILEPTLYCNKYTVLEGENDCTIREHTEFLQLEFKKLRPNYDRVNSSMTATLSDRRHKIVVDHSPIAEVIETWPWLKDENE
ncbi:hypothetical protein Avbf_14447, partial [Armadillidium vulgare]